MLGSRIALIGLMLFLIAYPASAQDGLYIRNKPFQGGLIGTGLNPSGIKVELNAIIKALGLRLLEVKGDWVISAEGSTPSLPIQASGNGKLYAQGKELPYTVESNQKYVNLKELGDVVGATFLYNEELATLDMDLLSNSSRASGGVDWGASVSAPYRLVYFGNDQVAPASKHFRPILQQIEKDTKVPVVWIDTEKSSSDLYRSFIKFFEGDHIPHTVLVNNQERVLKRWTGSIPYDQFVKELTAITKSKK